MSRYTQIMDKLQEILTNGLEAVDVTVELTEIGANLGPEVGLYLLSEKNLEQTIGMQDPYFKTIEVSVFCSEYSPDGVRDASLRRDALLENVKAVIHGNRNLGGLADITQFGDVEFESAQGSGGFHSAANLKLKVFVTS